MTAPVPLLDYDVVFVPIVVLGAGGAFGNERLRFTAMGTVGYLRFGGELGLLMTPWRNRER